MVPLYPRKALAQTFKGNEEGKRRKKERCDFKMATLCAVSVEASFAHSLSQHQNFPTFLEKKKGSRRHGFFLPSDQHFLHFLPFSLSLFALVFSLFLSSILHSNVTGFDDKLSESDPRDPNFLYPSDSPRGGGKLGDPSSLYILPSCLGRISSYLFLAYFLLSHTFLSLSFVSPFSLR